MASTYTIRAIREADDAPLAIIIRGSLKEFNANLPGTVYYDDTTDHLTALFAAGNGEYFVLEKDGEVCGGAGYFATEGLDEDTCELVKMYLSPQHRGHGNGQALMNTCITAARNAGFRRMYIETLPMLRQAISLYEKNGFTRIAEPLGQSGHTGCSVWMIKEI